MRYAIYFTPPRDHPLTQAASGWLGRDAFTDLTLPHAEVSGLALGELACITAAPRRYGFHGTLKAPFYFAEGVSETELMRMAEKFTASVEPVTIPKTEIARLGGFFAVVPAVVNSGLNDLAARVVAVFDKARAPLTGKEFERRGHDRLSTSQLRNLQNWGYPYVFDEFRFHMTLTGHVEPADRPRLQAALETHFNPLLEEPLVVDQLAIFVERENGAPFEVHSLFEIGTGKKRRTA